MGHESVDEMLMQYLKKILGRNSHIEVCGSDIHFFFDQDLDAKRGHELLIVYDFICCASSIPKMLGDFVKDLAAKIEADEAAYAEELDDDDECCPECGREH